MRFFITLLLLSLAIFTLIEARRKDDWRRKKARSKAARNPPLVPLKNDVSVKEFDLVGERKESFNTQIIELPTRSNWKKEKRNKFAMKEKHGRRKNKKMGLKNHMSWFNFKKDTECEEKCHPSEVCISGPINSKPKCVHKKDLKKSMKLFRRYQKKESKAWKRYEKKHYGKGFVKNYNSINTESLTAEDKKRLLQKDFLNKEQALSEQQDIQLLKKLEVIQKLKKHHGLEPVEAGSPEECSTSQFGQMRTRMMGWFHVMHGQDHIARKAHGGNIKHFYKHASVKKELREHDGDKCQCLKSALWQFRQMDNDGDDELSELEMHEMVENSLEPCTLPYLTSCDRNADGSLSSDEWCCCFSNVLAPCYQKVDEIRRSDKPVTYMPRCDKEGYYMREQCSGDTKDSYTCWCVDYNGNEHEGTRAQGRAHCSKIAMRAISKKIPMV